ncbi:hypothetical protein BH09VER1_BH09VER1_30160 [soil metagenome]
MRSILYPPLRGFYLPALALLATLFFTTSCSEEKKAETADVIILQSGRMRGNVYPLSLQSMASLQHYQYLAGYVKQVREEAAQTGAKVLVVDLGDSLTGSFATHVTGSENMTTYFNEVGYNAIFLSNLDNSVTPEIIAKLKMPVLNPFQNANGQPATDGTTFGTKLDLGGLPIYLLANFYGDVSSSQFPDRFPTKFGTTPTDVSPVRDYAKTLATLGDRKPGSLTLLSWMKFESPKDPPKDFLQMLTQLNVSAILAHRIYGGKEKDAWSASDFDKWVPPVSLNIIRNNGGFAIARLDLKRDGDKWRVLEHQLLPMTANAAPPDQSIIATIGRYADAITKADAKIGDLPNNVDQPQILVAYMSAMSTLPGTDAVLSSLQSVRASWVKGELRASSVYNSLPWTTPIVQITLTPEQLASAADDLKLAALQKNGLAPGPITVTTSEYFGRLIAAKLNLPAGSIRETEQKSEFDYIIEYLKSHPESAASPSAPTDWSMSGTINQP